MKAIQIVMALNLLCSFNFTFGQTEIDILAEAICQKLTTANFTGTPHEAQQKLIEIFRQVSVEKKSVIAKIRDGQKTPYPQESFRQLLSFSDQLDILLIENCNAYLSFLRGYESNLSTPPENKILQEICVDLCENFEANHNEPLRTLKQIIDTQTYFRLKKFETTIAQEYTLGIDDPDLYHDLHNYLMVNCDIYFKINLLSSH